MGKLFLSTLCYSFPQMNGNQLTSFDEIEKQLADKKNLETVYFEGNPLQKNDMTNYRRKLKLAVPQVKKIDAEYIRPNEFSG